MEILLLFLVVCFVIGLVRPEIDLRLATGIVFGMAVLVSIGYYVFRLT